MDVWAKMEKLMEEYKMEKPAIIMENMLLEMESYIKVCARNSQQKAEGTGVFIPFEDFFSNYYYAVWKALEDFCSLEGYSLKNVVIRRIDFAEKNTWKSYKKRIYVEAIDGEFSYAPAQWEPLEDCEAKWQHSPVFPLDKQIEVKELLKKLDQVDHYCSEVIYLSILGYTSSEVAKIMGIGYNYNATLRKKMQRLKKKGHKFMVA